MSHTNCPTSFVCKSQWLAEIRSLGNQAERNALLMAIVDYGVSGAIKGCLRGSGLDYFNDVIKPDIDSQHIKIISL